MHGAARLSVPTTATQERTHQPSLASTAEASARTERARLSPGDVVDRFRVRCWLGTGGHGVVYAAEHAELRYPVAIKLLEHGALNDPRRRARFRREAMLGGRVRHRNVVAILDAGELADGSPYLVMEHVEGIELAELLADEGPLAAAPAIELGIELLAASAALWQHGLVHRDIKPQNVMVSRSIDGSVEAKLLDLGIVKALVAEPSPTLTQEGFVLGTPHYMSPEQVSGRPLDVRSDLYAIGALLYEVMSGRPPLDADHTEGVLTRILVEDPVPLDERCPDCPRELAEVLDRALAKRRGDRYRTPAEMAEALRQVSEALRLPRGAAAWRSVEPAFARASPAAPSTAPSAVSPSPAPVATPSSPAPTPAAVAPPAVAPPASEADRVRDLRRAERLRPTPPERPSALRARARRPRFAPPWWAVGWAVVATALLLGSWALHAAAPEDRPTTRSKNASEPLHVGAEAPMPSRALAHPGA